MARGDAYKNKTLDASYGDGRAAGFPAVVYLTLYTVAPTDAGGGTEVVGGGYAPVAVANTTANWPAAAGGQKSNGTLITFPAATADYPAPVTHWALKDASSGAIIDWGALQSALTVLTGRQVVFNPGQLVIVCASA